ncbi:putative WRKY transcription factor 17 [Capsicum baccatum]|uniref:WRKY transcription factor 17 n=1 Tax=Capsicum baccatum TaxID=33114 RepID=A0A2G2VIH1_CAPBA|nr:putative WRKY transcription factor 17 [Capsicum baccatum]
MVLFSKMNKELALQEAASTGLKTMEHLIKLEANEPVVQVDCREITDFAIANLKKANSMVGRTGHARFRRGPVQVQAQNETESQAQVYDSLTLLSLSPYSYMEKERVLAPVPLSVVALPVQIELTFGFRKPSVNVIAAGVGGDGGGAGVMKYKYTFDKLNKVISSSSFHSSNKGEGSGSTSNFAPPSSVSLLSMAQVVFARKQSSTTGKRYRVQEQSGMVLAKRDECSWRKYGQKLIKGSPYPWAYYKCISFPGCLAKKHVERAMDDPMMLIVTYEEEHCHTQVAIQEYNSLMMTFGSAEEKKE